MIANDSLIESMTGIAPDDRLMIPDSERRLLLEEAQAGDVIAKEVLNLTAYPLDL